MKALHKEVFATLPEDKHHDAALSARISAMSFIGPGYALKMNEEMHESWLRAT